MRMQLNLPIGELIPLITHELTGYSDTAHLDAELLVMQCIQQSREYLLTYPEKTLTQEQWQKLQELVSRRKNGEPMAYILGRKEFWSLKLEVTPDVLIPRPETEHLVEWALDNLPAEKQLYIADLGAGSGAIACALASERPQWIIHATDNSPKALEIAERNAKRHHLDNIEFFYGQWCEPLPKQDYTAILSNPPYVAEHDPHLLNLKYEPREALCGGKDGLEAINKIISQAKKYLAEGGYLILEHGYNQREKVIALMKQAGFQDTEDYNDLAGLPRFVVGS